MQITNILHVKITYYIQNNSLSIVPKPAYSTTGACITAVAKKKHFNIKSSWGGRWPKNFSTIGLKIWNSFKNN